MKTIVLGAGIIGISTAWHLLERGHEVVVVDRQPDAALETSFANAAQISVSYCEPWANREAPLKALAGLVDRIDALVIALPPHVQAELSQLVGLLCTAAGRRGLAGLDTDWPSATAQQVQLALQDMRHSSLAVRQQTYQALHEIVGGAYFSDSSTWAVVGYPGPLTI